ncbi:MAG TPA: aspartate kinase [Gaiellaceae bacterium]|nr:aspartate kinase [Gaiellaceae bacterium]
MALIVQKFGGTSVGDIERITNVAKRVLRTRDQGHQVVVVVSAMAGETDRLLRLAHQITRMPDERELDVLVATGEQVSIALLAIAIKNMGCDAKSYLGFQIKIATDSAFGKARITSIDSEKILSDLGRGRVVVVAGFQGADESDNITTLGRGGSDTTAVALAAALGAEVCEIYTDVEGVFTADPRLVPEARKLHAVSYEEMLELAASGAKVLQVRSVEVARNHSVKLHVRSTFSAADGTWIREEDERMLEKALISGVTHTLEETLYRVEGTTPARLFAALAEAGVNVDTIVRTGPEIVFSAPADDYNAATSVLDDLGAHWSSRDDLGKVSVIGAGMKSHPGVAAKAFETLASAGIEPEVVTTSPIKIACHVRSEEVETAVVVLHRAFELDAPEAERAHA